MKEGREKVFRNHDTTKPEEGRVCEYREERGIVSNGIMKWEYSCTLDHVQGQKIENKNLSTSLCPYNPGTYTFLISFIDPIP